MNNQLKSTLPPKELSLFKRIVKCYEQKQFKNGLKFAKQILTNPKFAEHGETLAMKGLILSCLGKRDKAYEYVKKGIKHDIHSSICWHVYGLVQKSDRKYDEAMKCYLLALKKDKENIQILRDLSLLQVQMRNYEGYLDTRTTLFQLRPSQKASWLGYVVAQHLLENYDDAIKILEEYTKVQQNITPYNYEHSELLVYYVGVLIEAGKLDEALEFLLNNEKSIVDKLYHTEMLGELYMKMGKIDEAVMIYRGLIDRNPENEMYYNKLMESLKITSESEQLSFFDEYIEKFPRALIPRWIPLKTLSGDKFRVYADRYLKKCLRKGVWALFVQLKFLYSDSDKIRILEELYSSYKLSIVEHQTLDGVESMIEPPTTEIFVNYLLAQHYSFVGRVQDALTIVDNQLTHTPTLIDFYSLKGKIYYDAGNVLMASKCLDEAQSMDTADRYVNCVCTRYMVEAGRFKDSEEMAAKFTREGMRSIDNLNEMQCMWFLNTMAKSNQKLHRYGESLQKCHEVNKHFTMMMDDQFDFHSYCLRKTTLRSYVDLLRTEDKLRNHQFYFDAAQIAIEVYLHIKDHPVGPDGDDENAAMDNLTISEAKKLKSKQNRQKKKAETEAMKKLQEQEKRDQIQKAKSQDKDDTDVVEEKIEGSKLVQTSHPLVEATKFLKPLLSLAPNRIETNCLAYRVYEKKDKLLLMLKAVRCGLKVSGSLDNPVYHECLIRCVIKVKQHKSEMPEVLSNVVDHVLKDLPHGLDIVNKCSTLNEEFVSRNQNSLLHQFYAWHVSNLLNGGSTKLESLLDLPGLSQKWQDAGSILSKLTESYGVKETDAGVFQSLKNKFLLLYPHCVRFMDVELNADSDSRSVAVVTSHFTNTTLEENTQQQANGYPEA